MNVDNAPPWAPARRPGTHAFVNAHCPVPTCSPSRTAVLTGLRPDTSRVYDNRAFHRCYGEIARWGWWCRGVNSFFIIIIIILLLFFFIIFIIFWTRGLERVSGFERLKERIKIWFQMLPSGFNLCPTYGAAGGGVERVRGGGLCARCRTRSTHELLERRARWWFQTALTARFLKKKKKSVSNVPF